MKTNFFEYLDFALQLRPPGQKKRRSAPSSRSIGVGAGKTFDFKDLPLEHKLEVGLGMKEGEKKVEKASPSGGKDDQRLAGRFAVRRPRFLQWRLAEARCCGEGAAFTATTPWRPMYPITQDVDGNGEALDGSKHNYTITFPPDNYPPVNAFWSVTMYDGKTPVLIENPINRYLINSPMLPDMKTNADGSLTLYIQNNSPGADKESNWLPAPNGPIYLVMRLYWPKTKRPRSCRQAKAPGSRRQSWRRSSVHDGRRRRKVMAAAACAPMRAACRRASSSRDSIRCRHALAMPVESE